MPDKRQWLRSKGFIVGERGRFSHEMQCALADAAVKEGIKFDTPTSKTINTRNGTVTIERKKRNKGKQQAPPQPDIGWVFANEVRRPDLPVGWLVRLANGKTRQWTECYKCNYSIAYCQCPRPTMHPDWPGAVTLDTLT
jgi:hypothetical protein